MRSCPRFPAAALILLATAAGPAIRPTTTPALPAFDADAIGSKVVLRGRTHRPLGQVMTLTGIVVDGPSKGYDGGPNLLVQRIDGEVTQEYVCIPIAGSTFDPVNDDHRDDRLHFIADHTYALHGYETGHFVGLPADGNDGPVAPQSRAFYFDVQFALNFAAEPKPVDPVTITPADLADRPALLAGLATNADGVGWLTGPGWRLQSAVDGSPWPDWMVGKPAEVDGVVRRSPGGTFVTEHASRRLTRLDDQVGRSVDLHGLACNQNDTWCLLYRGQRVGVERMAALPGWSYQLHLSPVAIRGTLARDGARFVVRNAAWSPLPLLRTPELPPDWVGPISPYRRP